MDYVPVRVSTLRGDQKTLFDLYIPIGDRFVLYIRRGDSFEGERLARLKKKKIRKLFISTNDEELYRDYLDKNIEAAFDKDSDKKLSTRAEIVHGTQQSHVEEVFEFPDSSAAYEAAQETTDRYVNFLLNEDGAIKEMLGIDNTEQTLVHHCVTVATLSVALAQKLGTVDKELIPVLALGALLHDLGHHSSKTNSNRPLDQLSAEEMKAYQAHPLDGARIAQGQKHFDQRVMNIIMQHHECADGSGFPNKLMERAIDPLAMIVAICNRYDRMVSFEGLSRAQAAKDLTVKNVGRYPLDHIQALTNLVRDLR